MEKDTSSNAATLGFAPDTFKTMVADHWADVGRIQEKSRKKRVYVALMLAFLVVAYILKRDIQGDPLRMGLPHFGPDAMLWILPLAIIMAMGLMVAMPFMNGRSPHTKYSPDEIDLRFDDVRGIDVVLEEVTRSLQIFLAYKSFKDELGGNPRRGILFEGSPGTGKTHLAKAMSAEAGVPFFFVSAPAFQSMWFGMTAFKIRSYFKALKKAARKEGGAIGFIEEIDAVGASRGGVSSSQMTAHSEPGSIVHKMVSQDAGGMVNELLIQLQSFDSPALGQRMGNKLIDFANLFMPRDKHIKKKEAAYSNVLIIGATNMAGALDPALLRPGRFDRILHFDLPSRSGRRELIDYFLGHRQHDPEMDRENLREELASMTLGYSPAMLEHILDEALVWAIRDGRKKLTWRDIQRARLSEEIGLGQPVAYTEHERDLIATHEAGHAVAAYLCAKERKLEVLSIIKRRNALGLLAHSDMEERFTKTKSELEGRLKVALGGMAAEQLFFGESGTGPSSDLTTATQMAAQMVGSYGMGKSLISYEAFSSDVRSSANLVAKVLSNDDARKEVEELLQLHKDQVAYVLDNNRDLIEALRDALFEREELLGDEILNVLKEAESKRPDSLHLQPKTAIVLD
ncbi:MAG: cell division protease FtsH [Actinomycetota bacterium]|nr:cell division protease FtsH [Actinomycetota bacterium]